MLKVALNIITLTITLTLFGCVIYYLYTHSMVICHMCKLWIFLHEHLNKSVSVFSHFLFIWWDYMLSLFLEVMLHLKSHYYCTCIWYFNACFICILPRVRWNEFSLNYGNISLNEHYRQYLYIYFLNVTWLVFFCINKYQKWMPICV